MAEERKIETPETEYLNKIKSGYEKFGFDKSILKKAVDEAKSENISSQNCYNEIN